MRFSSTKQLWTRYPDSKHIHNHQIYVILYKVVIMTVPVDIDITRRERI
jgi:hypothetical protein